MKTVASVAFLVLIAACLPANAKDQQESIQVDVAAPMADAIAAVLAAFVAEDLVPQSSEGGMIACAPKLKSAFAPGGGYYITYRAAVIDSQPGGSKVILSAGVKEIGSNGPEAPLRFDGRSGKSEPAQLVQRVAAALSKRFEPRPEDEPHE